MTRRTMAMWRSCRSWIRTTRCDISSRYSTNSVFCCGVVQSNHVAAASSKKSSRFAEGPNAADIKGKVVPGFNASPGFGRMTIARVNSIHVLDVFTLTGRRTTRPRWNARTTGTVIFAPAPIVLIAASARFATLTTASRRAPNSVSLPSASASSRARLLGGNASLSSSDDAASSCGRLLMSRHK